MYNVTGTTFIRNAFKGGFPFESIIPVLSITDNIIIVDMGSDDGTLEVLKEIEKKNKRIKIVHNTWSTTNNPSAFADIANYCLDICKTPYAYFWQFDEILHENLAKNIQKEYEQGSYNLNFERIQLSHGGHVVKWLPHAVVRSVDIKKHRFDKDGMTVSDSNGTKMMCRFPVCDHHLSGKPNSSRAFPWHQPKPGMEFNSKNPTLLNTVMAEVFPWDEFLVDTSSMFRDNQAGKKELHHKFWNEQANIVCGMSNEEWIRREKLNSLWEKKEPSFPIPSVTKGLCGMTKYYLRDEIRQSIENDNYQIWGL